MFQLRIFVFLIWKKNRFFRLSNFETSLLVKFFTKLLVITSGDFYDRGGVNGAISADILHVDDPEWDWSGQPDHVDFEPRFYQIFSNILGFDPFYNPKSR